MSGWAGEVVRGVTRENGKKGFQAAAGGLSLQPLQKLQPMERWRLADILPISKHVKSAIGQRAVATPF